MGNHAPSVETSRQQHDKNTNYKTVLITFKNGGRVCV